MKTLIFIGGPTASGKTTLVESLNKNIPESIAYRRVQVFFDIATNRNISKEDIYKKIDSDEVDNWFVDVCKNSNTVISDVHYAVQLSRNGINPNENIDIHQNYVPTISKALLNKLSSEKIRIIAILLSCSSEQRLIREIKRKEKKNKKMRNTSIEDAKIESLSEKIEWEKILSTDFVEGIELNSELFTVEELTSQCLNFLNKYDKKNTKKLK